MLSIEALLRIWVSLYWEMCVLTMILTMCWCWFFSFPFDWLIQFLLVGRFSTFPSENYIILGKLCFLQYLSDLCVFIAFHVLCAFRIIFVHCCLILCVTCLFSGMCLLFGHVCIYIKATKATGGSQQGQQCKILFLSSDGGIFVFLSKPRKQQEVVEPQCSSYWPVATAAFLRPQTLQHQQQSQCLNICNVCLTCNICDFCNIFDISNICNISDNCKIYNIQILNHLKPHSGLRSTQYICIPVIALYETVVA